MDIGGGHHRARPEQSFILVLEIEPSLCTRSATGPGTIQFALDKGFLSL